MGCISKALLQEMNSFLLLSSHMKYSDGAFRCSVYAYTMIFMEPADITGSVFVCM